MEAGKNDPVTLIRGPSIRGHLRFWWRATRGIEFDDVKHLKMAEGKIWGTPEIPSQVSVTVEVTNSGKSEQCASIPEGKNFPIFNPGFLPYAYALFPFAGNPKDGKDPSFAAIGVTFKLTIRGARSVISTELAPALWAWVNFGGIGARPRRGCGALFCSTLAPQGNPKEWYISSLHQYGIKPSGHAKAWPTLPGPDGLLFNSSSVNPASAWAQVIQIFKKFRQEPGTGRNPGQQPNRPGRSRWPEADSLRRWSSQSAPQHQTTTTTSRNAFPRAEFGMPIIFHFKDKGDPYPDAQLLPSHEGDRMSSPLILRPLCISLDKAYPMVLRLNTETIQGARVEKRDRTLSLTQADICRPDLATYPKSPMAGCSESGSALEAFLSFARKGGYK